MESESYELVDEALRVLTVHIQLRASLICISEFVINSKMPFLEGTKIFLIHLHF